jgi:hypothetical protein
MENITPTNPETETADSSQVDHPAAQALKGAQAKLQERTGDLLTSYYDRIDEIKADEDVGVPFPEILTPDQRDEIIMDRRRESSAALYEKTTANYQQAYDEFAAASQKNVTEIKQELFGLGENGSGALSQAITADPDQLMQMIEVSGLSGDPTLARAAFAAAVTRDLPEVIHTYLKKCPEASGLLKLYREAPTPEWIKTQKQNVTRLIEAPTDDRLRTRPKVGPY